jgi:hypothetical protein
MECGATGHWNSGPRLEGFLTWFLEAKRWQKLNEDTLPCFLAAASCRRQRPSWALAPVPLEINDMVSDSRSGDRDRDFRC